MAFFFAIAAKEVWEGIVLKDGELRGKKAVTPLIATAPLEQNALQQAATAERLNLTQSALSVQIRKLEERLGHALFERRGRQLHLTEAGQIALDHADAIFAVGDDLIATLKAGAKIIPTPAQIKYRSSIATLDGTWQISFAGRLAMSDRSVWSLSLMPSVAVFI